MTSQDIRVSMVFTTVGEGTAERHPTLSTPTGVVPPPTFAAHIASILVSEKLAFCCIVHERMQSVYWYQGEVQQSGVHGEVMLQVKTLTKYVDAVMARIRELHPYDVPMIWATHADVVDPVAFPWISEAMGLDAADPVSDDLSGTGAVDEVFGE
jgi:periplasmic divalent cation tolerance protein